MANHKSALKRHRQSIKRRERNRLIRASIRTHAKRVAAESATQSPQEARSAAVAAEKTLAKAAAKGVIHKRTAQRKISRLAKRANQAGQASK